MINVTGKMAVLDYVPEINLQNLAKNLGYINIDILNIISINLSPAVDREIFIIKDSSEVRYMELGVLSFIELIETNTLDFFLN